MASTAFQEIYLGTRLSTDESFAYETLINVFSYLSPGDLFRASRVCSLWNWILTDRSLWASKIVRACGQHMRDVLAEFGDRAVRVGLYDLCSYEVEDQLKILKKYPNIRVLILQECDRKLVENIDKATNSLEEIHVNQILDNYHLTNKNFSLDFVNRMPKLKVLDVSSWFGEIQLNSLTCLKESQVEYLRARTAAIEDWKGLSELKKLKTLALDGLTDDIYCTLPQLIESVKCLNNLSCLHLEMYSSFGEYKGHTMYSSILIKLVKELPKLTELHLQLLYNFIDRTNSDNFINSLSLCTNIKNLYISFRPGKISRRKDLYEIANSTTILLKALASMKQLSKFTYSFARRHFMIINKYTPSKMHDTEFTAILKPDIPLNTSRKDTTRMIHFVNLEIFEAMLKDVLPNTNVNINIEPVTTLADNGCIICAQSPDNESEKFNEQEMNEFDKKLLYGSNDSDIENYSEDGEEIYCNGGIDSETEIDEEDLVEGESGELANCNEYDEEWETYSDTESD